MTIAERLRLGATRPEVAPALADRVFREDAGRARLSAQRKEGDSASVEVAVSCVRGSNGRVTHWVLAFLERA